MAGAYYFSCMDLMSAYYQVRMKIDHVKYTAFQAPSGLHEYLVLRMGVSNAPATMHRLTSLLFKGLSHTRSFYNDRYVFRKSKDINEHLRALRDVLEILKKNKLYVKLSKCVFCADEIPCLGDFIGRNGVRIDPDKVQTIRDWPVPRTQEQLYSFLGLTGYVQRVCEQYAELTAPLFTFFAEEASAMHLRTDATQYAVGGVLFQVIDGVERPIAYTNRKMKSAERKYPTQQQELLAIVNALATFRIYCLDRPVMVKTDHKSLEGIFQQKMANRSLARWYYILAEYQPTSYHLRIAEIKPTDELIKTIIAGYAKDKIIDDIRRAIKRRGTTSAPRGVSEKQYNTYCEENNLIWYQGSTDEQPRIVVPNIVALKHRIITEVHESNYGGHPGADRTYLNFARIGIGHTWCVRSSSTLQTVKIVGATNRG
ncbi:hypothetical protein ON010_g18574 [Phytophthora cinnamomi]|nr:hypothetical protein ON010_g18574 [Phytophthora cinnamomi]